ncbi:MAG: DUF3990 domain-containing protein [Firmicutes bacterium]|nr:DUF3990 domain-containing protein [Candidatus Colivicinus equi]
MKYNIIKDIEFIKEYLSLSDTQLSKQLNKPRSTFNYWKHNEDSISNNSLSVVYEYAYKNNIFFNKIKGQIYKDLENDNKKILFHGAKNKIVTNLDISYSKTNNDFGKGFYLGESLYQSATFVAGYPNSNVYVCEYKVNPKLNVIKFDVTEEWMLAIAFYRNRIPNFANSKKILSIINKVDSADIIVAPIADNNMYLIIENFIDGIITDKQCLSALGATNLGKQYVFKTNKALKSLSILEQCYLCESEKADYLIEKKANDEIGSQKTKMAQREFAGIGKYIEELLK